MSRRRWLVLIALAVILVVGGGIGVLRVKLNGAGAGDALASMLNREMRGRIEVDAIDWPTDALGTVVTGGWVPFTIRGVRIWDAERKAIAEIGTITAELDVHAFLFGGHDLVFRHVVIQGGWVLVEQIYEPYPLHDYDKTIVSIIAAFYTERKPGYFMGAWAASPPVFDIRDFQIRDLELELRVALDGETQRDDGTIDRVHYAVVHAHHVDADGFLFMDSSDPLVPKFYFSVTPHAPTAEVSVYEGEYKFDLVDLAITQLSQLPTRWPDDPVANSLELAMSATSIRGAKIEVRGGLIDYWDSPYGGNYDLTATVSNAGPMLHHVVNSSLGGDDVGLVARVTGPILYPNVAATLERLQYDVELVAGEEPLRLFLDKATVGFDLASDQGYLENTVARAAQHGPRGEVQLSAKLGLAPFYIDATLDITQPIDLAPWLPEVARNTLGSEIRGHFHARGDSDYVMEVDDLDLHLGALHIDRGTIITENEFNEIHLRGVGGQAAGTAIALDGTIDSLDETVDLELDVLSTDLDRWLRRAGLTAFARTASGLGITARGPFLAPEVDGTIQLGGVPVIDDLSATFTYGGGRVVIQRSHSTRIGDIRARGAVSLVGTPRAEKIIVTGRGIDFGRIPGASGLLAGKGDADLTVSGPLDADRIRLDGTLRSDALRILDQPVGRVRACLDHDPDDPVCREAARVTDAESAACADTTRRGGHCLIAGVVRPDGGSAAVVARTGVGGALEGRLDLDALPIDQLALAAAGTGGAVGGTGAVQLDLAGTLGAPTAAGSISLLRSWLFGAYLGDERLEVRVATGDDPTIECADDRPPPPRTDTGKVAICGQLLDGRVVVGAVMATTAPFATTVRADLRRVEVDPIVDLQALLGAPLPVRAWTSGTVTMKTRLGGATPMLDVQVELSELAILVDQVDRDGRPAPLIVQATSPLSAHWDGVTATLGRPVRFATPAGTIDITEARGTPDAVAVQIHGELDVAGLQPMLGDYFDDASGTIAIDASVAGAPASPALTATIAIRQLALRPAGQDTVVSIKDATIGLSPGGGLSLGQLVIEVDDASSGDHSELTALGAIKLDGLTPTVWGVNIQGELAAKMLLAFAPQALSQASGVAEVYVSLKGEGPTPQIQGDITFDPTQPFSLMPRGLRRDIVMTGGSIKFTDEKITLRDLSGSIDDEGRLSGISGEVDLHDWVPVSGDVTLSADGLPFRIPRQLDLVLAADRLKLVWNTIDGASVTGRVEIVQGRYVQDFTLTLADILPSRSTSAPSRPFWEEYPVLGNAHIDLTLDARSFMVENNIANIALSGTMELTGTPRDPRLEGAIQVDRGSLNLQYTRALHPHPGVGGVLALLTVPRRDAVSRHHQRGRLPRLVGAGPPDHAQPARPVARLRLGSVDLQAQQGPDHDAAAGRQRAQRRPARHDRSDRDRSGPDRDLDQPQRQLRRSAGQGPHRRLRLAAGRRSAARRLAPRRRAHRGRDRLDRLPWRGAHPRQPPRDRRSRADRARPDRARPRRGDDGGRLRASVRPPAQELRRSRRGGRRGHRDRSWCIDGSCDARRARPPRHRRGHGPGTGRDRARARPGGRPRRAARADRRPARVGALPGTSRASTTASRRCG